jgi:hypothetical protein
MLRTRRRLSRKRVDSLARNLLRCFLPSRLVMKNSWLFSLFLVTLNVGCAHVDYSQYNAGSGQRGYRIACGDEFERCELQAKDLCPEGFDRVSSSHRRKDDTPLIVGAANQFTLDIVCDAQPTDAPPNRPFFGASNGS